MQKKRCGVLIGMALLVVWLTAPVWAIPYAVGPYMVDVEVRNTIMVLIPDAKVSLSLSGSAIRLKATAPGYVTGTYELSVKPNQKYYKYDFVLKDPVRKVVPTNFDLVRISSAYCHVDQYGFSPQVFGITVFIPRKVWAKPDPGSVRVYDPFWGVLPQGKVEIEIVEDFYRVRLAVTRKGYDWLSDTFAVMFGNLAKPGKPRLEAFLAPLHEPPTTGPAVGQQRELAAYLSRHLTRDEIEKAGVRVPASLDAVYRQRAVFDELHRDSPARKF
jgi:hypothetical protein